MGTVSHFTTRALAATAAAVGVSATLAVVAPDIALAAPQDCNYMGYNSAPDRLGLKFDSAERSLFNMINTYRSQNGRAVLKESVDLARPAMWASLDDARRGIAPPDHIDSRGMGPAARAKFCGNYTGARIGEINYWGWGGGPLNNDGGKPEAAFKWWQNSKPHNALMLSPDFTTMSVARAYLGVNAEKAFWTVDFGLS